MDIRNLQTHIIEAKDQLGWSYRKLAEVIFCELNEDEVEDEFEKIAKFEERLKKQLKRSTTSSSLLETYLHYIQRHPDFIKSIGIQSMPITLGFIDRKTKMELGKLSQKMFLEESE